ncbi:hypothetical protein JCM19231_5091 [Vibrio ishigakensis]|uniref:Uncharacterized protein n=1 Tax=Vibrio ishigakensis TaxID=1481914 RepID=A0A0B8NWZ0_9VIBR|nr:hypothetical protein [Vibrio ishigakensis]GAM55259.1 hypothetical protein JCM19231_5091 [Vibrio ishigakensis]
MNRLHTLTALTGCALFSAGASACIEDRDPTESLVMVETTLELCEDLVNSVDHLVDRFLVATHIKQENERTDLDYWSNWMLKNVDDPILTQHVSEGYFGLGFYRPEEMTLNDDELTYEEMIKTYGVLLSVGIGEKRKNEPRVRLDYQWHERHEDVFHVQVEVPF